MVVKAWICGVQYKYGGQRRRNILLNGLIVLTLWCGLLISFELALFYCGKTAYEIISGETNYRELFQRTLATIGVGGLFYMIIEIFLKNVGMLK